MHWKPVNDFHHLFEKSRHTFHYTFCTFCQVHTHFLSPQCDSHHLPRHIHQTECSLRHFTVGLGCQAGYVVHTLAHSNYICKRIYKAESICFSIPHPCDSQPTAELQVSSTKHKNNNTQTNKYCVWFVFFPIHNYIHTQVIPCPTAYGTNWQLAIHSRRQRPARQELASIILERNQ